MRGTDDRAQTVATKGNPMPEVLIMIEGDALRELLRYVGALDTLSKRRDAEPSRLRIAVDEGQLKVKVNEHVWSPPMGLVITGEAAR